ncbi:aryl-sulfate sulfotransferase, partial [Calditrichota bacterium]
IGSLVITTPVNALDMTLPTDFCTYTVDVNNNPAEGYIYITPGQEDKRSRYYNYWSAVMDNDGNVLYFYKGDKRMKPFPELGLQSHTFDVDGWRSSGIGFWDMTYTLVDSINSPINELDIDNHDFAIFGEGDDRVYWTEMRDPRIVDMSAVVDSGNPECEVTGFALFKLNSAREVVWEWYSFDHLDEIPITDVDDQEGLTGDRLSYLHLNGFHVDNENGTIMISNRKQSEVACIKVGADDTYADGEVMWRLGGGRGNQFTFVNDIEGQEAFLTQHHCSRLDNGNILVFDDGHEDSLHFAHAKEYELDLDAMTATLVWSYAQEETTYTGNGGGAFRHEASGNTCIGWGGKRTTDIVATEVNPAGEVVWEITFYPPFEDGPQPQTYRFYKTDMIGVAAVPYVVTYLDDQTVEITCNWFGHEEEVASYDVFMGESPDPAEVHGNTNTGTYVIEDLAYDTDYYFRIKAFDGDGNEISDFSNQVMITPLNAVEDNNEIIIPEEFELSQNYPNPFNPVTTLNVRLPHTSRLKVQVYDIMGRQVAQLYNGVMPAGIQELHFDGNSLASGIYFVKLDVPGKFEQVRKIILMK